MSLPPKTKKLTLTLTTTILTHIWKTRNKPQFDVTIIPATNVIINIKSELKSIILYWRTISTAPWAACYTCYNFCVGGALCGLACGSVTMLCCFGGSAPRARGRGCAPDLHYFFIFWGEGGPRHPCFLVWCLQCLCLACLDGALGFCGLCCGGAPSREVFASWGVPIFFFYSLFNVNLQYLQY